MDLETSKGAYEEANADFDTDEESEVEESFEDDNKGILANPYLVWYVTTCCNCCCLLFCVALTGLGIYFVMKGSTAAGWGILGPVLAFAVIVACCYCMMTFEREGHHYNCCNYYFPLAQQFVLAFKGNSNAWYKSLTDDDPYVGHGPGPGTLSYYGWEDVAENLNSWGPMIENETMKRHGELGLTVFHSGPWKEMGVISTCLSNEKHALARPFIARVLDAAVLPETVPCDGSKGWNCKWLRSFFKSFFAERDSFRGSEISTLIAQLFHKIHLDLDVDFDEAKKFTGLKKGNATYSAFPPRTTGCPFFGACSGMNKFNKKRQAVVDEFKSALRAKFSEEDWSDEEKLAAVANMFCDSMLFAGGLSVPQVLTTMLALWYSDDRPPSINTDTNNENSLRDFMLETIRRHSPVAGVGRYTTEDGGDTWTHEFCNLRMANRDARVFPDPMKFLTGRPGMNHSDMSLSCAWADQAKVNDDVCHPNSHYCPGKKLSQEIIVAFMQEFFLAGPWSTNGKKIKITDLNATSLTFTKAQWRISPDSSYLIWKFSSVD